MPRKRTLITKDSIRKAVVVLDKHSEGIIDLLIHFFFKKNNFENQILGISPQVLKHLVTSVGEKLTQREFEDFLAEIEVGSDGTINIDSILYFYPSFIFIPNFQKKNFFFLGIVNVLGT